MLPIRSRGIPNWKRSISKMAALLFLCSIEEEREITRLLCSKGVKPRTILRKMLQQNGDDNWDKKSLSVSKCV